MNVELEPGKYVVAVSGGVDSVALLDLLVKLSSFELVVAHYDHGVREDSANDRRFVESLANKYGLPFEYSEGQLGPNISEAEARSKRYEFLRAVQIKHRAAAIITAHHQDDLLETAIINLMRGTGRKGLSSLKSTANIRRPLLGFTKRQIINYAKANQLAWREDSTNSNEAYLRNWIRRQVVPRLNAKQRSELLSSIQLLLKSNQTIDSLIDQLLTSRLSSKGLDRLWFNQLPHGVAKEIMMAWLRRNGLQFDRHNVEQLVIAAKTYKPGKLANINKTTVLKIGRNNLALAARER